MRLHLYGPLLAALTAPAVGLAQSSAPATPVAGYKLVKEGIALHDAEKYGEAAARYQQVLPGDSVYATAQAELALSLWSAGKYQEALEAAKRAQALEPFEPHTYATLGDAYESLKQPAEARAAYAAGLKLFPYNENLWINQGIFELGRKNLAVALPSLQRSIELRPDKASGHRLLGYAAVQQGQLAHAMISYLTFLALDPDGHYSNPTLVVLERISEGVPTVEPADMLKPVAPNTAFEELDQLIAGRVALNPNYTTKVKFKAAIVKQLQLLVEKFPVDADPKTDFWVRTYGPMVKALRQDDNLTAFTYLILSSAEDKSAQQWVKSNKGRMEKLGAALAGPLTLVREQQPLAGASAPVAAWFDEGRLQGLGPGQRDAKGEMQPSGDWVIVGHDGSITQRGAFSTAGKRSGKWVRLRPDGSLAAELLYKEGDLDGPARYYHRNGQLQNEATYQEGKLTGMSKKYAEGGQVSETRQFANNDYEGEAVDYYSGGQPSFKAAMHADKRDGVMERYYPDGTLESRGSYAQDKAQGEVVLYYPDKTPAKKVTYANDELSGPYTSYHPNGKELETGQFARGKRTGQWREYFSSGKLSAEKAYDENGELHGTYVDYDRQGRHFCTNLYEHGRLVRVTYYDPAGKVRTELPLKKSRTLLKSYDIDGHVAGEGPVENGTLVGEWKHYYADGTLREVAHYDNKGQRTGVGEVYYANGQLQQRRHYGADGQPEGYVEQFYQDGQPQQTGFELNGEDEGQWKTYYSTGQLSQERQLFRGELSGPARFYTPGGKLAEERLYAFGKLRRVVTYDSTGQVIDQVELPATAKELVTHYAGPTHKVLGRAALANGEYDGPTQWLLPSGQPQATVPMREGKRYGAFRNQYADGKTMAEGQYLDGKKYGAYANYYPDGTPSSRGHYLKGEEVGEWSYYFPNGKLQRVVHYNDLGDLDGVCRYYNPAGELLLERRYEGGQLVGYGGPGAAGASQSLPLAGGAVKATFANGKPAVDESYAHNDPAGPYTYYYASGQVFQKGDYQKGLRSGRLVSYWPDGKPMEEEYYLHGELHGRCRYYRPDGTLEREESYRAGERSGPWVTCDAQGHPVHTDYYWNNEVYSPK